MADSCVKRLFTRDPTRIQPTEHRNRDTMKRQPCFGSLPRAHLQTLPIELLHLVFDHLSLQDVPAARKTCSALAHVGTHHFGDEVPLVYHRDKFQALCEIAKHPQISKRMRSLFYVSDRCLWVPYEEWDHERPDPQRWKETNQPRPYFMGFDSGVWNRQDCEAARKRISGVSESSRRKGYEIFEALCQDAIEIHKTGYDLACLRSLFRACPQLREVTITSKHECTRRLDAELKAFADAMTPLEDHSLRDAGLSQVLTLATAVQEASIPLDSLTLRYVSPGLFGISSLALRAVVRPLRRLRMLIQFDTDTIEFEDWGADNMLYLARMNNFRELLAEARDLRVLNLHLPVEYQDDPDKRSGARLDYAIGDVTFAHLYELTMGGCEVEAEFLVDLILRHKATLRRLSLGWVSLINRGVTPWRTVFTRLSGQLPKLYFVSLSGELCENGRKKLTLNTYFRRALEEFVMKGGQWPSSRSSANRRSGRSNLLLNLPDDNMERDDPARHYKRDEFDQFE